MKKIALAVLLSSFVAAPAFAANDLYAGIKVGSANKKVPGTSESSTAVGVFGGYTINPNFAVEVGYTDLGKVQSTISFTSFDVSALGSWPINQQFSLYGKVGLASTKEEAFGLSVTRSAPTYGLGGQYNVTPTVGIRLGWDRHSFGDDVIWRKGDSDLVSVAGVFKF